MSTRSRRARALAAAALATVAAALTGFGAAPAAAVSPSELSCLLPTDAAAIDRVLAEVGSPLAGLGGTFVARGRASGVDPRALVAIAAHETLLETYAPARAIHNPFGLGPGIEYASEAAAIEAAASTLRRLYFAEGLVTLPAIAAKWAPLGVDNDPTDLNQHWTPGVSAYYSALGGDPSRSIALAAQDAVPACGRLAAGSGQPVLAPWNGRPPATAGPSMVQGGDPVTGLPAAIGGFVFPLALAPGGGASYGDDFADVGAPGCYGQAWRCGARIASAPRTVVVAAVSGLLRSPSADEGAGGVAFWIDRGDGDRLGYGPLASYQPGIGPNLAVRAGQVLGIGSGVLDLVWERRGARINPFPLLRATRPSDG
jgi:hypothetical protein